MFIVTVHMADVLGVEFADQPPNPVGLAVSCTAVPLGKYPVHPDAERLLGLQLIPGGLLVTVPVPCPTT